MHVLQTSDGACTPTEVTPDKMREYEIYIPTKANDGTPLNAALVHRIKAKLVETFGGYTHMTQQMEGAWRMGEVEFRDDVTILRVLDAGTGTAQIADVKEAIRRELNQSEVLVVERSVHVI